MYPHLCLDKSHVFNLGCSLPLLLHFLQILCCPAISYASNTYYSPLGTLYACKYIFRDLMPMQHIYINAISGALWVTPIRNLEVVVGVLPLGIELNSIQKQLRARL